MPPAVGNAAAISAIDKLTMKESPPTIVQFENAAVGPPVYMTKPKRTGMPDTKFMDFARCQLDLDAMHVEAYCEGSSPGSQSAC
jgi:hypothetical protein